MPFETIFAHFTLEELNAVDPNALPLGDLEHLNLEFEARNLQTRQEMQLKIEDIEQAQIDSAILQTYQALLEQDIAGMAAAEVVAEIQQQHHEAAEAAGGEAVAEAEAEANNAEANGGNGASNDNNGENVDNSAD